MPILQHGQCHRHSVFVHVARSNQTCRKNKRSKLKFSSSSASPTSFFFVATRDTTSKFERQRPRTEHSTAAARQGQEPFPKSRYKRCQNWNCQRETRVQLNCGKIRLGLSQSRKTSLRRANTNLLFSLVIILRPLRSKPIRNTNAQRQEEKLFCGGWWIANVDTLGRVVEVKKSLKYCIASQLTRELSHDMGTSHA